MPPLQARPLPCHRPPGAALRPMRAHRPAAPPPRPPPAATADAAGVHVSRMRADDDPRQTAPRLALDVRASADPDELRAVAWLRARSFYVHPPERAFAGKVRDGARRGGGRGGRVVWRPTAPRVSFAQIHQALKAEEEHAALLAATAAPPGGDRFAAVVALADRASVGARDDEVDGLATPSGAVVVGTLDVVAVRAVKGEVLIGDAAAPAYMANVCTAPCARRRGVGAALLAAARSTAAAWDADALFVHALAVNEVAARFYLGAGFVVEASESIAAATRRGHCLDGVEGLGRTVLYRDATFGGGGGARRA